MISDTAFWELRHHAVGWHKDKLLEKEVNEINQEKAASEK